MSVLVQSPSLESCLFEVSGSMFGEAPRLACRAIVVVPARNEERSLPAALDALRGQRGLHGQPLAHDSYEVLVLLNNCTDNSCEVVRRYAARHPDFALRYAEASFAADAAHVGTARRLLMDAACERLEELIAMRAPDALVAAILSTDADTRVAPDWVAQNLLAIERGAEVVGGMIDLDGEELASLDPGTRLAYERDRRLGQFHAELESLLDPDPCDPWPRHLEHFGASIACTAAVYRRCGGLPAVKTLEDVAFVDALRRVGARIRHAPEVRIETSARLDGRVEIGLSGQLRHWRREVEEGTPQIVDSADWLVHRFAFMHWLRCVNEGAAGIEAPAEVPHRWRRSIASLRRKALPTPRFLEVLDCDALIEETFVGERDAEITVVLVDLEARIATLRAGLAAELPVDAGVGLEASRGANLPFALRSAPARPA